MANEFNANGCFGLRDTGSGSDNIKAVNVQGKFDSFGRSLLAVKEKQKAAELEQKLMVKDIEKRLINARKANQLQLKRFHGRISVRTRC